MPSSAKLRRQPRSRSDSSATTSTMLMKKLAQKPDYQLATWAERVHALPVPTYVSEHEGWRSLSVTVLVVPWVLPVE